MDTRYNAEDVQVLEGLTPVRKRPGMYIGSVDQRGLHQLVLEVVYNSVDEAIAGWCSLISITIYPSRKVMVEDDGRGIPVEKHPQTGVSTLETVMTHLHAGAKFGGRSYRTSGGLHGVGVSVVNALSSYLKVETRRNGNAYVQEYSRGIPQSPVRRVDTSLQRGTTITFLPDEEMFQSLDYDFSTLAERFRDIAYLAPGLSISLKDERREKEATFCFEGGIKSFVEAINQGKEVLHPPIHIVAESQELEVEVGIQFNEGYEEEVLSFANCVKTADGGSHVSGFRSALTRILNEYGHRVKLLKDNENLIGEDTRGGLSALISVKLAEPQFEGQTKGRLGNSWVKGEVERIVAEKLTLYLDEHPSEAKRIVEKCLSQAHAREAARKARDLVLKRRSLDASLAGKLAECTERNPQSCELFIVEGESAGGSAKQGRDRRFQAILPLKGKILNVEKASEEKIFSHEEILALITALGAGVDPEFTPERIRYHTVIIMTDADVDGSHIRTLLLTFFFRRMAELIEQGHLFIAQPPLYRLKNSNKILWVYSDEEKAAKIREFGNSKIEIQRYKGLGEMNPDQLWETTMNPANRMIIRVDIEDAMRADHMFRLLMGEEVEARREFIRDHAKLVTNVDV
jgi:DNA gyrase subunit B